MSSAENAVTFKVTHLLHRYDYASPDAFEDAIDEAIRLHNPWALRKTLPNTDQWIVDVLDIDRATASCAYAFSVELLAGTSA